MKWCTDIIATGKTDNAIIIDLDYTENKFSDVKLNIHTYVTKFWKTVDIRTIILLHLKTMGEKCKLQKKNYVSFYCLTGGRIKSPMDKSWPSLCSPVHG